MYIFVDMVRERERERGSAYMTFAYAAGDCCQAYSCITGNSTGCESCVDQDSRTTDAHCAFCNGGYYPSPTQVHTSKDAERIWSTICKAHFCNFGAA